MYKCILIKPCRQANYSEVHNKRGKGGGGGQIKTGGGFKDFEKLINGGGGSK